MRAPARLRPVRGGALGIVGVAALTIPLLAFLPHVTRAASTLVLVVPVVVAALLGGRSAACVVSVAATVAFTLLLPPYGSVRVHFTEDLVALVVFGVVSVAVGTLVAGRVALLQQVDEQRVALLRSVSHDLRTPLASIRAAASDLASGEVTDLSDRAELLQIVSAEADRLDRLVANLLSLGRIEAGFLRPERQAVDVAELVDQTVSRLGPVLSRAPLEVCLPADLPAIDADHALVQQVLVNLLENASRHSPAGEAVRIEASVHGPSVAISVLDQGPGIDDHLRAHLFEPFRSGSVAGSSGVGLAICKAIVEAHGGTIVASDLEEPGTRFTVTFPCA